MTQSSSHSAADGAGSPEVGDFVVVAHRYSFDLEGPLARVTAQKVFFPHRWRKDDLSQAYKDAVLFSGPEPIARLLVERLTSSRALKADDERKAYARHEERKREAVAKAWEAARAGTRVAAGSEGEAEAPGETQ